ncbi:hypothetical protein ACFSUJ_12815 [Streptomyces lusitanus]|uniref:PQQ-binding-like beta-propeller repeat protein n=1 Tax=Streptomyces lusitanus TaxID=68232 RepID=A0ABU3JPJ5_9ACTN|nr:hypothetical protein [Streptomyces lusitanus]
MRRRAPLFLLAFCVLVGAGLSGDDGGTTGTPPPPVTDDALVWEPEWTVFRKAEGYYTGWGPQYPPVELGPDRTLTVRRTDAVDMFDTATGRLITTMNTPQGAYPPEAFRVGDLLFEYRAADVYGWPDDGMAQGGALSAYDGSSGRLLWQQRGPVDRFLLAGGRSMADVEYSPPSGLALTEKGVVAIQGAWSAGQDAWTGRNTWTREEQETRCREGRPRLAYAVTRRHVLMLRECAGEQTVLEAIDPETGRAAWQRKFGELEDAALSVGAELIGVNGTSEGVRGRRTISVLDETGRRLATTKVGLPASRPHDLTMIGRSGNTLLLHLGDAVHTVPVGGGTASRRDTLDDLGIPQVLADGTLVSVQTWADSPYSVVGLGRPVESVIHDVTGRRRVLPVPGGGEVVGLSGDVLITQREMRDGNLFSGLRLKHRRSANPSLGGVPPSDWPDACTLLSNRALAAVGPGYVRLPVRDSREVFGVQLPRPSACRFATPSANQQEIFDVRVQWVAGDPLTAGRLVEVDLPWADPTGSLRVLEPRTYLYRPGVAGEKDVDSAVIKVMGRHILMVTGRDADLLVRVAARLR